jgi:hypothetical protein
MLIPTEGMLEAAAQDVAHEIFLFWAACGRTNDRIAYQSWYILARNLMDFFDTLPSDRFNDSVLAGDYFDPPGTWHGKREEVPRPSDYAAYLRAAHKRAAHLSYGRAAFRRESAEPCDPSAEISEYLLRLAWLFLNSLLPERQQWFREAATRENFQLPWDLVNPA